MVTSENIESARRDALAEYLRHCRASRRPEDFGMPSGNRRKVPGLRREEVAVLAHISSTWYTQLEQGRQVRATVEVIDAIAEALELNRDEHDHLRLLAGYPGLARTSEHPTAPALARQMVEEMPYPASLTTPWFDYLAWNSSFVRLVGVDPARLPSQLRNPVYVWQAREEGAPLGTSGWEKVTEALVAQLRFEFAEYGEHPRFKELLDHACATNAHFATLWKEHNVRRSMDVGPLVVEHPSAGTLSLQPLRLTVQEDPSLRIGVYVPATAADREKLRLHLQD